MMSARSSLVVLALLTAFAKAFAPAPVKHSTSTSQLQFGIPSFGPKDPEKEGGQEKKIGLSGLVQLITAGMGSPFLGDFEGVDEETGKMMFSLEANNLVDENGESKQTKMPYFENGWVDPEDIKKEEARKAKGGFRFW